MHDSFVTIAGKRFHHVWLRDNCLCERCRDPYNFQKMLDVTDLPTAPRPSRVSLGAEAVVIEWDEEPAHRSTFRLSWLMAHAYDHSPDAMSPARSALSGNGSRRRLWTRDSLAAAPLLKHDFKKVAPEAWVEQMDTYGFAVLTGVEDVIDLIRTIGPVRPTETGLTYDVGVLPADYGLSQTNHPLLPHNDYEIFMQTANLLQFLHCVENRADGGESVLVDGFAVAEDFRRERPDDFRLLSEVPAQFEKFDAGSGLFNRRTRTVVTLGPKGDLREVSFNNSHAWQWDIPFDLMEAYYRAYGAFFRALKDEKYHYCFRLEPGDCYVVQGFRVLHSRRGFAANSGKRHMVTAFTEADYLAGRQNFLALRHLHLAADDPRASAQKAQRFRFAG